jgi:two-component system chemotaxis response regulator CheY
MKILVVDDSKAMRMIVIRNIRQAGHGDATVLEAENGLRALEVTRAESPDLILCDWNMPEMNGLEYLVALRAEGIATTFGFVTSESTPAMRDQAMAAGASFLLAKPFSADDFQKLLADVA